MAQITTTETRPHRATVPILVSFESESFTVRDFSLDLSVGGIFLLTDRECALGTEGKLKFRSNQFEDPFTISGRVVRVVTVDEASPGKPAGLGIKFTDATEEAHERLERLVSNRQGGHVVESIRAAVREKGRSLAEELRRRPVDHKLMLAVNPRPEELRALIHDANPTVLLRLTDYPRLTPDHILQMLRNRNLPTRVMTGIYRLISRETTHEIRWMFITHPNAMLSEVERELRKLDRATLKRLSLDPNVRQSVKLKAKEMSPRF
jgi:uncharacterized protein (TIGR02266 family)